MKKNVLLVSVMLFVFSGCKLLDLISIPDLNPDPEPTQEEVIPLDQVTWLHTDVSSWEITTELKSVSFSGNKIILDYDADWAPKLLGTVELSGNAWIFVKKDGRWYAATWEWLRHKQKIKGKIAVMGNHIKRAPLHTFAPVVGETYGFMVSGLARDGNRNVMERSSIILVTWK